MNSNVDLPAELHTVANEISAFGASADLSRLPNGWLSLQTTSSRITVHRSTQELRAAKTLVIKGEYKSALTEFDSVLFTIDG